MVPLLFLFWLALFQLPAAITDSSGVGLLGGGLRKGESCHLNDTVRRQGGWICAMATSFRKI